MTPFMVLGGEGDEDGREAKSVHQLAVIRQMPPFQIFLGLCKAYDALEMGVVLGDPLGVRSRAQNSGTT